MRGIHDGPDLTNWPDAKPDPKRGRALLIVVAVLALACGVYAGVQDGPDGVDPLGETHGTVFGGVVQVGPDNIYPHGGLDDASMTCSREQEAACVGICEGASGPGEISSGSSCHKRLVPVGQMPGMVMEWYCTCTWVKAPLTAGR